MFCKTITVIAVLAMIITGCSIFEHIVYRPSINQGNYLLLNNIAKIHIGMTQQQVSYVLGTPMIHGSFGNNVWYYVFRQVSRHKHVKQQLLILTFDSNRKLINIKNKL